MQPIDKNTLFSIFEKGDEEIYREHNIESVLDNPYVLIGMVVQGIQNYQLMDLMYTRHHSNKYEKVKNSIKYKYFCKLYAHLARVDLYSIEDKFKIGSGYDIDEALLSISDLLFYFESIEEYEKCITIKSYLDFINKNT